MKSYSFAPISAREYPTLKILDNPYIWGGVRFCVNVSEKPYSSELEAAMASHGIEWVFCPVSEDEGSLWWESMEAGLMALDAAHKAGKKIVVHCDCGNNRSRSFVEAFHYMITGKQFEDEYKGEINHLAYNCKAGHLPSLEETEKRLSVLWGELNQDKIKTNLLRIFRNHTKEYYGEADS